MHEIYRGEFNEKVKICGICSGNHSVNECQMLKKMIEEIEKPYNLKFIVDKIKDSGISKIGNEALKEGANRLSNDPEKMQQVILALVSYYRLEGQPTVWIEAQNYKFKPVKIDKDPIRYDGSYGACVLRYQEVKDDGTLDEYTKGMHLNNLNTLTHVKPY